MAPRKKQSARSKVSRLKRLDLDQDWSPMGTVLKEAVSKVGGSGAAAVIEDRLRRRADAVRRLSVFGLMVASMLNGWMPGHKGKVASLVRVLNGFTSATLARLGMPDWRSCRDPYGAVDRLLRETTDALDRGWDHVDKTTGRSFHCDWAWFQMIPADCQVPESTLAAMRGNTAAAIDGTEVESCGQFHGDQSAIELDGDDDGRTPPANPAHRLLGARTGKKKREPHNQKRAGMEPKRAAVLGVGPDERNVYTKDPDARAGWRTGNAHHPPGPYIGRELHALIAVRKVLNTNGSTTITFGPQVPPIILDWVLTPAGTHRADAVLPAILRTNSRGLCADVVLDPGYTLSVAEKLHYPLQKAGIDITMRLVTHQRGEKPGVGPARLIDGHLFAEQLPEDLVDLPMPPVGASDDEMRPYIERFDRRAAFAYSRHKAPGNDGTTRWRHPLTKSRPTIRSREVPSSMRGDRENTPLVTVGTDDYLGIIAAGAYALPHWQRCLQGTSAWWASIGRRQLAETFNSALHGSVGSLTEISRGYTVLRDSSRIMWFMAFTVAGYNRMVIKRWEKDMAERSAPRKHRPRKGRLQRYEDRLSESDLALPA